MRFSIWPSPQRPWNEVLELSAHAARTGWDGVYFADHFMPNTDDARGPLLECWSVLAGLAAAVPRVRLGALVTGNTYRHPAVLANMAATVDHISGGRLVLGLGAGWQQNEHDAYGIELPSVPERLARFEEACTVVSSLLRQDRTTFDGRYYRLADAPCEPKPVQPHLPLLLGGGGERVTLRIAARHADEWNCWGTPDVLRHKIGVLERHCEAEGRDPSRIARSAQALVYVSHDQEWLTRKRESGLQGHFMVGTPGELQEIVGAYRDAGVDELIVPDWNMGPMARRTDTFDLFLAEVAGPFRD